MFENQIIEQIALLLIAATPISIILAKQISKIVSPVDHALGKTDTVVTDVIGTLIKDELEIRTLYFNNIKIRPAEKDTQVYLENPKTKEATKSDKINLKKDPTINFAALTSFLCHYPKMESIEKITCDFFSKCGFNSGIIKSDFEIIQNIPSSDLKKISTVVVCENQTKDIFSFSKGNPKLLLSRCSRILIDGVKKDINTNIRVQLKKRIKRINQNGQKIIAFAYKGLPLKRLNNYTEEFAENDLVFLGMIVMSYPINNEVKSQIELIKSLGIKPYILSSIKEKKSVAAGIELGIINQHYSETVDQDDMQKITDQKLTKMMENREKDYIFTGLGEADKNRIIQALKNNSYRVAVINPPSTTFKDIVKSIRRERTHKENLPKQIFHSFACKIAEIIIILASIIFKIPIPITISILLIIEILINLPLELALNTIKPEADIFAKDYNEKEIKINFSAPLINGFLTGIIIFGIYIFNLMSYGWYWGDKISINDKLSTKFIAVTFILLAISQIINAFTIKSGKQTIFKSNPFSNKYLVALTVFSGLIIYATTSFFITENYLNQNLIQLLDWEIIAYTLFIILLLEELRKLISKRHQNDTANPKK